MFCGLYIHIPFCVKKCLYCDFASVSAHSELHKMYFAALNKEIAKYKGCTADSIFIGGGTPSCVDERYISGVFEQIHQNMTLSSDCEISIEVNPGTITADKLCAYKACGINRISIGVQSFQDNELAALGRIHSASQATEAVSLVHSSGFDNVNLDLMLATPYQTLDSLKDTLCKAAALSPSHISAYSLIVEPDTPFYTAFQNGKLPLPDEDAERDMYDFAVDFLCESGYMQYEISNFAKNGAECIHNLKYWRCLPYIGIGAAAHSYDTHKRYANTPDVCKYIDMMNSNGSAVIDEQILTPSDKLNEYIIMAMRLVRGIELDDFYEIFGFRFEEKYKPVIDKYINSGFLEKKDNAVCFTHRGIAVSNTILCDLITV